MLPRTLFITLTAIAISHTDVSAQMPPELALEIDRGNIEGVHAYCQTQADLVSKRLTSLQASVASATRSETIDITRRLTQELAGWQSRPFIIAGDMKALNIYVTGLFDGVLKLGTRLSQLVEAIGRAGDLERPLLLAEEEHLQRAITQYERNIDEEQASFRRRMDLDPPAASGAGNVESADVATADAAHVDSSTYGLFSVLGRVTESAARKVDRLLKWEDKDTQYARLHLGPDGKPKGGSDHSSDGGGDGSAKE